jgi:hypothetical protein
MSNRSLPQNTLIFNKQGLKVGSIRAGVFRRNFQDRHILRDPPALALDSYVLAQLQALGVVKLELKHKPTGEIFRSSLEHFLDASFPLDRGYGPQLAMPLAFWIRERPGGEGEPDPEKPRGIEQLSLFGGGGQ